MTQSSASRSEIVSNEPEYPYVILFIDVRSGLADDKDSKVENTSLYMARTIPRRAAKTSKPKNAIPSVLVATGLNRSVFKCIKDENEEVAFQALANAWSEPISFFADINDRMDLYTMCYPTYSMEMVRKTNSEKSTKRDFGEGPSQPAEKRQKQS